MKKSNYPFLTEDLGYGLIILGIIAILAIAVVKIGMAIHNALGLQAVTIYVFVAIFFGLLLIGKLINKALDYSAGTLDIYKGTPMYDYKPKRPLKTTIITKTKRAMNIPGTLLPGALLPGERAKPPRAVFFGRINGQSVDIEGDLEEKWLTYYELQAWKEQKAKNGDSEAPISNENEDWGDQEEDIPTKSVYTT